MTKEEELIARWIDGELNPKEKIEFEKLYDARPDFYNSLRAEANASKDLLKSSFEFEKEIPYGDFFNNQIRKKIQSDDFDSNSSSGFLFDVLLFMVEVFEIFYAHVWFRDDLFYRVSNVFPLLLLLEL